MAICRSKGALIGCLMIGLLVCMSLIEQTNARNLGYGIFPPVTVPGCSPRHARSCTKIPSNPYGRGCEAGEKCRHHPVPGRPKDDNDKDTSGQVKGEDDEGSN